MICKLSLILCKLCLNVINQLKNRQAVHFIYWNTDMREFIFTFWSLNENSKHKRLYKAGDQKLIPRIHIIAEEENQLHVVL